MRRGDARGRRRVAPRAAAQPHAPHAQHRADQLRGGRADQRRPPTRSTRRSTSCSCRPRCCRTRGALLAHRRPRPAGESTPWMFHLINVHGLDKDRVSLLEISHETDRARFIGRGRDLSDPLAMHELGPLSNTGGAVLDPVAASRCVLGFTGERTRTVDLVTGAADSREACLALIDKYRDRRLADRVFELAWTHAQVLLRQLDIDAARAQLYARLAGMLVYAQPTLRADEALIRQNRRGQSGLWGYSISGDLPIVLVTIADAHRLDLVRQLVQAHAWWRQKGLARRPGDLERGARHLPPAAARADPRPGQRRPRSADDRPARRRVRAPRRPDRARGPRAADGRGARGLQRRARHAEPSSWRAACAVDRRAGRGQAAAGRRAPPPLPPPPDHARAAARARAAPGDGGDESRAHARRCARCWSWTTATAVSPRARASTWSPRRHGSRRRRRGAT